MAAPKGKKSKKPTLRTTKRKKPPASKPASTEDRPALDKPAPFVPKISAELKSDLDRLEDRNPLGGRPTDYGGRETCNIARALAAAGLPDSMIARSLGVVPSTFYLWKACYPEFSECLLQGEALINEALKRTTLQRALGYSYETQKAFQTGVVVTITETMPPSEKLLAFLLERRLPDEYGDKKKHEHTFGIEDGLRACLEDMNDRRKLNRAERAKQLIDRTNAIDAEVV